MSYVVAIELDTDEVDHKVFRKEADARKRYWTARAFAGTDRPVPRKSKGDHVTIVRAALYEAESGDPRDAVAAVKSGSARKIEASDDIDPVIWELLNEAGLTSDSPST